MLNGALAVMGAVEPVLEVVDQVTDPIFQVQELGCGNLINECD
jgi:hypothetical protein